MLFRPGSSCCTAQLLSMSVDVHACDVACTNCSAAERAQLSLLSRHQPHRHPQGHAARRLQALSSLQMHTPCLHCITA